MEEEEEGVCVCEVVCRARKVPSHKRLLPSLPRSLGCSFHCCIEVPSPVSWMP